MDQAFVLSRCKPMVLLHWKDVDMHLAVILQKVEHVATRYLCHEPAVKKTGKIPWESTTKLHYDSPATKKPQLEDYLLSMGQPFRKWPNSP